MKTNFHIHTTISDGKVDPEDVIKECIKEGIRYMCFTDHYPAPNNLDPFANGFYKDKGFQSLVLLKEKYKDKINISIGAEFDWIPGYEAWYKGEIAKRKYDFVIGAVHALLIPDKKLSGFWDKKEEIEEFIKKLGGGRKYAEEYFKVLREMIKSRIFDCVGHFDILKLNNLNNEIFSEDEDWYKQEVRETLDLIKKEGISMEINTRGILKQGKGRQYPSLWILKEANKRKIPITVGTDFHNSGQIEPYISQAYELAKEAGYSSVNVFIARIPKEIKI